GDAKTPLLVRRGASEAMRGGQGLSHVYIAALLFALLSTLVAASEEAPSLIKMARSQGLHEIRTGDVKFIYAFTRQGRMRETLVLLPGAVFSTMVLTPGSRRCVSMFAAMPFNLGDGAVLR